jgi:hypothetical protein
MLRGESRPASAINVDGHVKVKDLYGTAIGLEVGEMTEGNATGRAEAETVHEGGSLIGAKLNKLGGYREA